MSKFITLTKWADVPQAQHRVTINADYVSALYPAIACNDSVTVLWVNGQRYEVLESFEQVTEWLGGRL